MRRCNPPHRDRNRHEQGSQQLPNRSADSFADGRNDVWMAEQPQRTFFESVRLAEGRPLPADNSANGCELAPRTGWRTMLTPFSPAVTSAEAADPSCLREDPPKENLPADPRQLLRARASPRNRSTYVFSRSYPGSRR